MTDIPNVCTIFEINFFDTLKEELILPKEYSLIL